MEQAAAFMGTQLSSRPATLFFGQAGNVHKQGYFSTISARALSQAVGLTWATANDFRHMFITAWRDFISCPSTQLAGLTAQQMEDVAASMMLNSAAVWEQSYDISTVQRGMNSIIAMWPKFMAFVEQQHLDKTSEEPFDPLLATLAGLGLE
jgi:hypothetical protein